MNERKIIEVLAGEIERATAAGDGDRAQKLADLQGRIIARISREIIAADATEAVVVPLRQRG